MDKFTCPNKYAHVSAFPGYGRIVCPYCRQVYVKSPERIAKELFESMPASQGK